jgi:hypothetical protein
MCGVSGAIPREEKLEAVWAEGLADLKGPEGGEGLRADDLNSADPTQPSCGATVSARCLITRSNWSYCLSCSCSFYMSTVDPTNLVAGLGPIVLLTLLSLLFADCTNTGTLRSPCRGQHQKVEKHSYPVCIFRIPLNRELSGEQKTSWNAGKVVKASIEGKTVVFHEILNAQNSQDAERLYIGDMTLPAYEAQGVPKSTPGENSSPYRPSCTIFLAHLCNRFKRCRAHNTVARESAKAAP